VTPPRVKICGLTRREDAAFAEANGAAYLGAILAGGPRLLTPDRARHVLGPPRHGVRRVAVFGDSSAREVIVLAGQLELDVVQLHGDRSVAEVATIARESERQVWPVLRIAGTTLPPTAADLAAIGGCVVLDAHVVGQLGGTGVALDWSGLAESVLALREAVPGLQLILAGGLRAENVREAIRLLSPQVVDVSSGVESAPGVKDPARVQQFVQAALDAAETSQ
jgi:phosphoribosylanthranilate isomerase